MEQLIDGATCVYEDVDGNNKRLYNLVTPSGGVRQLSVDIMGEVSFYAKGPLVSGIYDQEEFFYETDLQEVKTELESGKVRSADEESLRELAWELDEKYMQMR